FRPRNVFLDEPRAVVRFERVAASRIDVDAGHDRHALRDQAVREPPRPTEQIDAGQLGQSSSPREVGPGELGTPIPRAVNGPPPNPVPPTPCRSAPTRRPRRP